AARPVRGAVAVYRRPEKRGRPRVGARGRKEGEVAMAALLETRGLTAFYGDFQALFGIDFTIAPGETVAIIGANGAGKSTFLKTICGLLPAPREAVYYEGEPIGGVAPGRIVAKGVAMVPEGRRLFPSLDVEENLLMGAYPARPGPWTLERVYEVFPALARR